ncbi:MAG TPA: peptidoglycan-binding protein, partial [Bacillota bacterium]
MLLKIVKTTELPFGKRILGRGAHGAAVRQLQEILTDQGFYAEPVDGNFGILTEEAVMLLQKAFQLKVDGVVGPATYNVLQRLNHQPSRIIYTVKKGDRLTEISRQFGVTVTAWKRIADPRREIKRIYPGMKLLLYQKALLTWEENLKMPVTTVKVSGTVNSGLRLDSTGAINPDPVNLEPDSYYLIQADPEIWEQCLASKKYCQKVAVKLQALQQYK